MKMGVIHNGMEMHLTLKHYMLLFITIIDVFGIIDSYTFYLFYTKLAAFFVCMLKLFLEIVYVCFG